MADKIVQPKVLASTNPDTYDNLIIAQAQNATYATYASSDTSKGTIEERLTNLGFRQGAVILGSGFTASINTLKRQGNYVLGELYVTDQSPSLSEVLFTFPSDFTPISGTDIVTFSVISGVVSQISISPVGGIIIYVSGGTVSSPKSHIYFGYEAVPIS